MGADSMKLCCMLARQDRVLHPIDHLAGVTRFGDDLRRKVPPRVTRCTDQRPDDTFAKESPFLGPHVEDHCVVLSDALYVHRRDNPFQLVQDEVRDPDVALDHDHAASREGR